MSSDSEVEALGSIIALSSAAIVTMACAKSRRRRRWGGSRVGKRGNVDLQRLTASRSIDRDYFGRRTGLAPLFSEKEFERRYRMPRVVYEQIRDAVCDVDTYFVQRNDALGNTGASTDQKITSALRQLSLGISADSVVEYVRLAESTNAECLKRFASAIRAPTSFASTASIFWAIL